MLNEVFDKYNGICQCCGERIKSQGNAICHHYINREDGGNNSIKNLRLRHMWCEKEAHEKFVHGNKEEGYRPELFNTKNRRKGYTVLINGRLARITYPNKSHQKTTYRPQPIKSKFGFRRASN